VRATFLADLMMVVLCTKLLVNPCKKNSLETWAAAPSLSSIKSLKAFS
jgi:hypothetical protein